MDDSKIDTNKNYHVNKMGINDTMTYRVEKWIPPLSTGYRFDNLYRWELELSPAMEVTGYRFTFDTSNPNSTSWKTNNTNSPSTTNSYITYEKHLHQEDFFENFDWYDGIYNPLYFYNWDANVVYPSTWIYLGMTEFFRSEYSNCKNNIYVFDLKNKLSDNLYGTYLILEVDVKKKDDIDLSDSQYQYLQDKTHNFNGGYYFSYKSGAYQFANRNAAIEQEGVHGLLKLHFDPAKAGEERWIQDSHRWDYARDVFTIFQYKLTTKVKHGSISTYEYLDGNNNEIYEDNELSVISNSTVTSSNDSFAEKIVSVDAAKPAYVSYEPQDGYALKRISVDGVEMDEDKLNTYLNSYQFGAFNKDHVIEVEYVPGYTITTEVINGTIDPDITDIPEGSTRSIGYKPNEGYALKSITVDGIECTAEELITYFSSYSFKNIQANHHIKVVYEMAETSLTIKKRINQSEIYLESGIPVFFFEVSGTDYKGETHTYYRMIDFDDAGTTGYVTKTIVLDNIPAGTYMIREIDNARYKCSIYSRTNVTKINDTTVKANTDVTNGGYNNCSVIFANSRTNYRDLDHSNYEINAFKLKD